MGPNSPGEPSPLTKRVPRKSAAPHEAAASTRSATRTSLKPRKGLADECGGAFFIGQPPYRERSFRGSPDDALPSPRAGYRPFPEAFGRRGGQMPSTQKNGWKARDLRT